MKSDVARFTTYVQTCQQPDLVPDQTRTQSLFKCLMGWEKTGDSSLVQDRFYAGDKTRNISLQLFLQQCRLRAVSLFSWSVELNARDTQITTRVTEGARRLPPSFLASRGFAAKRSHARALPLLNLKKKRDCSQSRSNVAKQVTCCLLPVFPYLWSASEVRFKNCE